MLSLQSTAFKIAFGILVLLLAVTFLWRPLTMPFSGAIVTNDFVLESADGMIDSKSLHGKVLAVVFAHADCHEACASHLSKLVKAYEVLNAGERIFVKLLVVTVTPEKDTPARMKEYAARLHPDVIGLSGKPEDVQKAADGFAVLINKGKTADGNEAIVVSPMIYVVDAEGRFSSVLNDKIATESIAQSLRSRIPTQLPPGR